MGKTTTTAGSPTTAGSRSAIPAPGRKNKATGQPGRGCQGPSSSSAGRTSGRCVSWTSPSPCCGTGAAPRAARRPRTCITRCASGTPARSAGPRRQWPGPASRHCALTPRRRRPCAGPLLRRCAGGGRGDREPAVRRRSHGGAVRGRRQRHWLCPRLCTGPGPRHGRDGCPAGGDEPGRADRRRIAGAAGQGTRPVGARDSRVHAVAGPCVMAAAGIVSGARYGLLATIISAWPAVAFFGAADMLLELVPRSRSRR